MSEQRPVTITAAEFVAGDYAAKIARGECVVTHLFPMELFTVHDVYEGQPNKSTGSNLYIEYMDIDDPAEVCNIRASEQLTVTWLPQPEREEAAAREFADGWRDAEIARLKGLLSGALGHLVTLLTDHALYVNYVYSHNFKAIKPDERYSIDMRQEIIKFGVEANKEQNSALYSASEPDHK